MLPVLVLLVVGLGVGAGYGVRELSARSGPQPTTSQPTPGPTTTASPIEVPGSRSVQLAADALTDPSSAAIQALLQRHFDAINNKDFEAWRSTVTRQRASAYPKEQWQREYGSTADGSIVVHRIEPTVTGSVVLISFTSTQDRELAPNQLSDCLHWRVSYAVVVERGELRLAQSAPEASQFEAC